MEIRRFSGAIALFVLCVLVVVPRSPAQENAGRVVFGLISRTMKN